MFHSRRTGTAQDMHRICCMRCRKKHPRIDIDIATGLCINCYPIWLAEYNATRMPVIVETNEPEDKVDIKRSVAEVLELREQLDNYTPPPLSKREQRALESMRRQREEYERKVAQIKDKLVE